MVKTKFKIKETDARIKSLFDGNVPMPGNVTFFVFENSKAEMWRVLLGIFIGCMIIGFPAFWFTTHDPPGIFDWIVGITGTILLFVALGSWLWILYQNQVAKALKGKYRYGLFFFSDCLVLRVSGSSQCSVLRKEFVRSVSIRWFSNSDTSDVQLISVAYSGTSKELEELIVDGDFMFGYKNQEIKEYIEAWKSGIAWKAGGLMVNDAV